MKTAHAELVVEKKGHICPPSSATHPSMRWENGLNSPMEFEESLLTKEPNPILTQILARFVLNLKPQTRNLSSDQISSTVASTLVDFLKTAERTIFWNEELKTNVDPFYGMQGGFFSADWDFKLKILRVMVELQLCHSTDIKKTIDTAWGVGRNTHKKKDPNAASHDIEDGPRLEDLQLIPIGQDLKRRRYWVVDDSPRIYHSTNPWKITATFQAVSSNKVEYDAAIASLRAEAPPEPRPGEKRPKLEQAHHALIRALEERTAVIEAELNRIQRSRRRVEQRNLLLAQADLRETRTRQRSRPNYAYMNDPASGEEDYDEYKASEEDESYEDIVDDEQFMYGKSRGSNRQVAAFAAIERRRSSRTAATATTKPNEKRPAVDEWAHWRGERRSTRLGAPDTTQDVPAPPVTKRTRTDDSSVSAYSEPQTSTSKAPNQKSKSAAALKPTEFALDQVAGKKKSKFWYYAVEPVPDASGSSEPPPQSNGDVQLQEEENGIDELSELSGGDD